MTPTCATSTTYAPLPGVALSIEPVTNGTAAVNESLTTRGTTCASTGTVDEKSKGLVRTTLLFFVIIGIAVAAGGVAVKRLGVPANAGIFIAAGTGVGQFLGLLSGRRLSRWYRESMGWAKSKGDDNQDVQRD